MSQARPERGTKRTCLTCDARFYDLARVPAICPKCGAEYVEIVRPAPVQRQLHKRAPFGKGHPGQPLEAEHGENLATSEARLEDDDDREPDEEREEEFDDEAQESEVEDAEE